MNKLSKENFLFFLLYVLAFLFGAKQLREPDLWWQLLSGDWMLAHMQITRADVFSYTFDGTQWINVKWLYEVFISFISSILGVEGVILLQCILNVLILYFLNKTIKVIAHSFNIELNTLALLLSTLVFLVAIEHRLNARPEMFGYLFISYYLYKLVDLDRVHLSTFWPLLLIQIIWSNMHESYPVGVFIIGIFLAVHVYKQKGSGVGGFRNEFIRSIILFGLVLLGVACNPNGFYLITHSFELLGQVKENVYTTELYSIGAKEYWTYFSLLGLLVGTVSFLFLFSKKINKQTSHRSNLKTFYFILLISFFYLAFNAQRNTVLLALISFPLFALALSSYFSKQIWVAKRAKVKGAVYMMIVSVLALISLVSSGVYYERTNSKNLYGFKVSYFHNPFGASSFIKRNKLDGPAFSDYFVSSYLLWDLYPQFRSFIDLRDLDVFSKGFMDEYLKLNNQPQLFKSLDKQYGFNYIVLSTSQLLPLQYELYWKEGYNLVYVDPVSVIYLKQNERNKHLNEDMSIQQLFSWPRIKDSPLWARAITKLFNPFFSEEKEEGQLAPVYAANYYREMKNYPLAIRILSGAMTQLKKNNLALSTMSNIYTDFALVTEEGSLRAARLDTARFYARLANAAH